MRCTNCGAPLNEQPMTKKQAKAAKNKPKKPFFKRVWVWVLIVIIVVFIIAGSCGDKSESDFSEGFQAGMEAANEPAIDVTEKPQENEPTQNSTPVQEGEFGVDANGNAGPDRIALITYVETALEDILKQKVEVITWEFGADDWDITRTLNRYVLKGRGQIGDAPYDIIIKLEFDETYETYTVFQLKIDGKNIDLP